jgi:hypothetical protein
MADGLMEADGWWLVARRNDRDRFGHIKSLILVIKGNIFVTSGNLHNEAMCCCYDLPLKTLIFKPTASQRTKANKGPKPKIKHHTRSSY